MKKVSILFFAVLFVLAGCSNQAGTASEKPIELHISVAASLKDVMEDVKTDYEKAHKNVKLTFDFAGSGQIKERVKNGAPIDGVLLASEKDMDDLKAQTTDKQQFAKNTLVLIVPSKNAAETNTKDIAKLLPTFDKIAIGNPESVPAGKYAEETMENLGVYDALKEELVLASDVRQTLAYVASGNAQAGFVYKTDALISKDVKVLQAVPDDLHSQIGYYSGVLKDADEPDQVAKFLDYMASDAGQKVLAKYGFLNID
ncbi:MULTISPECIES: molybdate ABC transporter substrate-binding protein [Listeria]|uniref:molybdate ABC transporter substrate-binding protein n=1 Tax=Listeria TaxID=1637 RepID=UPI000B595812|nr:MULTISPECIES: molybdate ABC transporter substrate-binding protein [Listeria]